MQPIINPNSLYSGCYGRADINFFAYNAAGKKGVGCGLNNLQKLEDGEPLSDVRVRKKYLDRLLLHSNRFLINSRYKPHQPCSINTPSQAPQYSQPAPVTQQPLQYIQGEVDPITGQPIVIDPVTGQRVM
ncbi:MAG: ssDNA-binding protein [Eubacteriales bacterium]